MHKTSINGADVPPGALVSFIQKGLQYLELEANLTEVRGRRVRFGRRASAERRAPGWPHRTGQRWMPASRGSPRTTCCPRTWTSSRRWSPSAESWWPSATRSVHGQLRQPRKGRLTGASRRSGAPRTSLNQVRLRATPHTCAVQSSAILLSSFPLSHTLTTHPAPRAHGG